MSTTSLTDLAASVLPNVMDDESLYEVVEGRRVEIAYLGAYETVVASLLDHVLGPFAKAHGLGRVATEVLFLIDPPTGLKRRPDLAFVSFERWPRERRVPSEESWDVVPNLAVEVVSPTNTANAMMGKIREYFAAGVEAVWMVYPLESWVYVYDSPTTVHILTRADDLDGGRVLPGLRIRLAEILEDEG